MFEKLKERIDNIWRPRTEIGRNIKHFLLYREKAPRERRGRRFLGG